MNLNQLNTCEMIYNSDKFGFNQKRRFYASDINNAIEQAVSWLDEKLTGDIYNELVSVKMKNSQPLTWDEVANIYDSRNSGRKARTLPMGFVFDWVAEQSDFFVGDDDCLYRKESVDHR